MSEPLLQGSGEEEYSGRDGYEDVYASESSVSNTPRPLSNGVLFLVLSIADWEKERLAMMKENYLNRFSIDYHQEDELGEEEPNILHDVVRDILTKALCCLRKSR